jgi:hypothetical protein
MDFSQAFIEARLGKRIRRAGWPDGTFVVYQKGYPQGIEINANTAEATGLPLGERHVFQPYLMKLTEDGSFVPWVPDMTELFALDWVPSSMAEGARTVTRRMVEDALVSDNRFFFQGIYLHPDDHDQPETD